MLFQFPYFCSMGTHGTEGCRLVSRQQATVAHDVGDDDRGEPALCFIHLIKADPLPLIKVTVVPFSTHAASTSAKSVVSTSSGPSTVELSYLVRGASWTPRYNVRAMLEVPKLEELNIGHSIISRAVFTGLERAIRDMLTLLGRP